MAAKVTEALGGWGLFGVELFIAGSADGEQTVYFSEVSPRPHDTGMVTMVSQNQSEFALHVRAILGLPIGEIELTRPGASAVILAPEATDMPHFSGMAEALSVPTSQLRLFSKPRAYKNRRMGVALALGDTTDEARDRAKKLCEQNSDYIKFRVFRLPSDYRQLTEGGSAKQRIQKSGLYRPSKCAIRAVKSHTHCAVNCRTYHVFHPPLETVYCPCPHRPALKLASHQLRQYHHHR